VLFSFVKDAREKKVTGHISKYREIEKEQTLEYVGESKLFCTGPRMFCVAVLAMAMFKYAVYTEDVKRT
jgi:hypothetical protein